MSKPRTPKNRLQGAELRQFRHKVSQLKKKGLVSKRTDARKQKPTRYMIAKVKVLEPVLTGEAVGVKISREFQTRYKEAGFQVFGGRVVVKKDPDEVARARHGLPELKRVIASTNRGNLTQRRIPLPARVSGISQFIADLRDNSASWDRRKRDQDVFAFTFMGGRSRATFGDAAALAEYLETYVDKVNSADDPEEVWETIELYSITLESLPWNRTPRTRSRGVRYDAAGNPYSPSHRSRMKTESLIRWEAMMAERKRRANMSSEKAAAVREKDRARKSKKRLGKDRSSEYVARALQQKMGRAILRGDK